MVHLVDAPNPRQVEFFRELPNRSGYGFTPDWRAFTTTSAASTGSNVAQRFMHEHMKAGSVDEVDLHAVPLGEGQSILHRRPPRDFLFVVRGHGAAVFDPAQPVGHLGGVKKGSH